MRLFLLMICLGLFLADAPAQQQPPYHDLTHDSRVFGHPKAYRLYLPAEYEGGSQRYPVVYFFHGWGGRHFKDDNAKLDYVALQQLVNKYRVIMVMWDGNIDESEPRPYNVGYHEDVKFRVQMKDYFPELTAHIDSTFRTLTDRQHRGIIGFSMGGIMSLYLGGLYPDKVSAVVSIMGSPEFFIGYPERHTLYPVRYTFGNLKGVRVRMHTSPTDILYGLNEEVRRGAAWEGGIQLDYQSFEGGHMVDHEGETKVFESALRFVTEAFKDPLPAPAAWSHYDLYPAFEIRGYKVESNLREPGFLYLRHVNKSGWGLYSPRWLPLGPPASKAEAKVTTPAIYEPAQQYQVMRYDLLTEKLSHTSVQADALGRLQLQQPAGATETAIYREGDAPSWTALGYALHQAPQGTPGWDNTKSRYLKSGNNILSLRLMNRGGTTQQAGQINIRIRTNDPAVTVADSLLQVAVAPGVSVLRLPPVRVICRKQPPPHAAPAEVKVYLQVSSGDHVFDDEMIVPVWFDAGEWTDIKVDDGRTLRDSAFGTGNGNGVAEPGERILLYKDSSRLKLYTEDPWVAGEEETLADEIIPARWPDGFTLSAVIKIKKDCPPGHEITFLASYETKTFNPIVRKVHWGSVRIRVGAAPGATGQTADAPAMQVPQTAAAAAIRLTVVLDSPAAGAHVSVAPLRYNKLFAYSFTLDDGLVSAARVAFPFFAGGKTAPSFKDQWGADQGADGKDYPGLYYTDGCGHKRPFTAAVAVNAHSLREDSTPGAGNLSWNQLERMTQAGWEVLSHGFTHATGKNVKASAEVENNTGAVRRHLHLRMRHFVIPGGKDDDISLPLYATAAFNQGLQVVHSSYYPDYWVDPANHNGWRRLQVGRYFLHTNMDNGIFREIEQHLETGKHYWLNTFTHSVGNDNLWNISFRFEDFAAFFNRLAATYGKDGADNMWFAPPGAVYNYEALRRAVKPGIRLNGNKLLITFDTQHLPTPEKHGVLTFIVHTGAGIREVHAENCTVESYGGKDHLINIIW